MFTNYQAMKVKQISTLRRRFLPFSRVVRLFVILLLLFSVSPTFITTPSAKADDGVGWDAINTIYYNPAQEDAHNPFLQTAARELETYLEQMSGRSWTVVTNAPPAPPAINLAVNATMLAAHGDEAFRLVVGSNGVTITGKTAIAVRWGAYYLLDEKLGVRWFFKGSAWTVVPTSLTSIANCDEIHEPDFYWREIWGSTRNLSGQGNQDYADWVTHNRGYGSESYKVMHSYAAILDHAVGWNSMTTQQKQAYYDAHPTYFMQNGYGISYWQLNGDTAGVRAMALSYAEDYFSGLINADYQYNDDLLAAVVPISPNDGGADGWLPLTSTQAITDNVFGLVNYVAENIDSNKYAGCYTYAGCSGVPSFPLAPNVLSGIAFGYNSSGETNYARLTEYVSLGATVGVRDYLGLWGDDDQKDKPRSVELSVSYDKLRQISWLHSIGAVLYEGEMTDAWGASGLDYYLIAKMLWDSSLDYNDLVDDFFNKCFGAAADVMRHYYENIDVDSDSLAKAFNDLHTAEGLVSGNALTRVRYLEYYTRFVWLRHNIGLANLSLNDLKSYYTFLSKIRDTYMLAPFKIGEMNEAEARAELKSRGQTDGQVDALIDYTLPTPTQAATWLSEALTAFSGYGSTPDYVNPMLLDLTALGNNGAAASPIYSYGAKTILVESSGSETIAVNVKSDDYVALQWYSPSRMVLDTYIHDGTLNWTEVDFDTEEPGTYMLLVRPYVGSDVTTTTYIDIPNHPAAMLADGHDDLIRYEDTGGGYNCPRWYGSGGTTVQYFYVPTGTSKFEFHATAGAAPNFDTTGKLTDPNNADHTFNFVSTSDGYVTISSPASGLWKLTLDTNSTYEYFWFQGIPPLIWHDPEYLLVPADSTTPGQSAGDADINSDGVVNILDIISVAQHWGESGPNDWIAEDVNSDGIIDVLDITFIVQHWTR